MTNDFKFLFILITLSLSPLSKIVAQCTASNSLQFINCLASSNSLYIDQSYTVFDDIDISGVTIDIKSNKDLILNGITLIDENTFFTGNGSASVSDGTQTASPSPGQGQISFAELNSRIKSGQYTTFSQAMSGTVLPVLWKDFFGEWSNDLIVLNWSTAMELNNDFFEVQHSADSKHFKTIDRIYGAGTTSEVQYYQSQFSNDFVEGVNYYRLKQFDFDGQINYSPIIVVKVPIKNNIRVRPTVVSNMLYIDFETEAKLEAVLQIINSNGQLLVEVPVERGIETLSMDLSALEAGFYYARLLEGNYVSTANFIKK